MEKFAEKSTNVWSLKAVLWRQKRAVRGKINQEKNSTSFKHPGDHLWFGRSGPLFGCERGMVYQLKLPQRLAFLFQGHLHQKTNGKASQRWNSNQRGKTSTDSFEKTRHKLPSFLLAKCLLSSSVSLQCADAKSSAPRSTVSEAARHQIHSWLWSLTSRQWSQRPFQLWLLLSRHSVWKGKTQVP